MTAYCKICGLFFIFIIMENEYTEFLIGLIENRIRALRLKLDRSKNPVYEDDKLTSSEVTTIEAWKDMTVEEARNLLHFNSKLNRKFYEQKRRLDKLQEDF